MPPDGRLNDLEPIGAAPGGKAHAASGVAAHANRRSPALLDLSEWLIRIGEGASVAIIGTALAAIWHDFFNLGALAPYGRLSLLAALVFATMSELLGAYDADCRFSIRNGWGRISAAWLLTAVSLVVLAFFLKASDDYSRGWSITWFVSVLVALAVLRAGSTLWMRRLKAHGLFNQRVAIFGGGAQGDRLAKYIRTNKDLTIDLIGFFDSRTPDRLSAAMDELPLKGDLNALMRSIRAGEIDQVLIALPLSAEERLQAIVSQLAMLPVLIRLSPDLAGFAFAQKPVVMLGDVPVVTLFERPISGIDRYSKKLEDVVLGAVCLLLALPLMAITALAILIESGRPVLFRQARDGYNNRTFTIWKFRSMHVAASQHDGIDQARKGDARVTRVGRLIRATSIDELPQLFNVLRGEMSLVGPRPHAASTRVGNTLFSDAVATYAARHKVKPGVTGWAQVNGWRGETDTEEKLLRRLEHDLYYIENWSIGFDLYILTRTIWTVIGARHAY